MIALPLMFSDLDLDLSQIEPLVNHLIYHDIRRGSKYGHKTRRLRVHPNSGEGTIDGLSSLIPHLPHLVSFASEALVYPAQLFVITNTVGISMRHLHIAFVPREATNVLPLIHQFAALQTLSLDFLGSDSPDTVFHPLRTETVRRLSITVDFALETVIGWLADSTFEGLTTLHLGVGHVLSEEIAKFSALKPWFEQHTALRQLELEGTPNALKAILSQPMSVSAVSFVEDDVPDKVPRLRPSVRHLAFCEFPALPQLWGFLDSIIGRKKKNELALTHVYPHFVAGPKDTDFHRRFRWSTFMHSHRVAKKMLEHHSETISNLMVYALELKRVGITMVDEEGFAWPSSSDAGTFGEVVHRCVARSIYDIGSDFDEHTITLEH
jgi:hypothetical protein